MVATIAQNSISKSLQDRIEKNRKAQQACRDSGRDIEKEIESLVGRMFEREALIQTYNEYEARGFHWVDEVDDD